MSLSSLELIDACHRKGLLSKEAAAEVLGVRERLIKIAIRKEAVNIMGGLKSIGGKLKSLGGRIESGLSVSGRKAPRQQKFDYAPDDRQPGPLERLGKIGLLTGLTVGATHGIHGLMRHSKDKALQKEVSSSYKQMIEDEPDLGRPEVRDRTRTSFGILARYAPSLAAEPAVAGPIVQSLNAQEGGATIMNTVKTLAEMQNRIDDTRERHAIPKLDSALSSMATKALDL